jgi:hypothetical protein
MTAVRSLSGTLAFAGRSGLRSSANGETCLVTKAAVALATALGITVASAGAILLLRRLAGGFDAVPSAAVPWAVAVAGIPLVLAVEAAARLGGDCRPVGLARGGLVAAALAVAPLAAAVAWPTWAAGLVGTAVTLLVALRPAAGWRPLGLRGVPGERRLGGAAETPTMADGLGRTGAAGAGFRGEPPPPAAPALGQPSAAEWATAPLDGFRQRLERYETPAGEDCVRGQLMLAVAAGSRTGHAHVGFCPSFATLPLVEVTINCDFVEAEVAAAEVLPWGVRVECRLSEPAEEPLEIPVAIRAIRPA